MWSNGTNDDPGWPTLNNGAYDPWREARTNSLIFTHRQREEDTRRPRGTQESPWGGLALLLLLLGGSALAGMRGLLADQGVHALLLGVIGLCWLLGRRHYAGWRWLSQHVSRGRPLLLILMLGAVLSGCESMERGVAKLHGIKVDPLPGPCAPESFQAGQCVKVKQEGARP